MSKKCVNCGVELDDAALFCDECGAPQTVPQELSENQAAPVSGNVQPKTMNQETTGMKFSGFGIASLVLGIIAICTFGVLLIPEILGLIFGIIGITHKDTKHSLDIAGITTSIISILLFILIMLVA